MKSEMRATVSFWNCELSLWGKSTLTKNVQRNIYFNVENGRIRRCTVPPKKFDIPILSLFIFYFQFSSSFLSYCFIFWSFSFLLFWRLDSWILFLYNCLLDFFPFPAFFLILHKYFYLYSPLVIFLCFSIT